MDARAAARRRRLCTDCLTGAARRAVDEASRRKQRRLLTAAAIAIAVAGSIVFLIERFYDPAARAREAAIAAEVGRMTEQQKVSDNLAMIEMDVENAIMKNDFATARTSLAALVAKSPDHPRREFLQASIDRAEELARLSPPAPVTAQAAPPAPAVRAPARRIDADDRAPIRAEKRTVQRAPVRAARESRPASPQPGATRTYGAPISEPPVARSIPLDSPINSEPTSAVAPARSADGAFSGRPVETGAARVAQPEPAAENAADLPAPAQGAPAAAPPDVIPAKIVKRVTPVAPLGISPKTAGYVVVRFNIQDSGRVSDVEILESSPQGVFDESAQEAVRKWLYEPRRENGVAVASSSRARLVFEAQ
jgi:protein TonB